MLVVVKIGSVNRDVEDEMMMELSTDEMEELVDEPMLSDN